MYDRINLVYDILECIIIDFLMDNLTLLLVVYVLYLIVSIILFDSKILSPSIVFFSSFTFMLSLACSFKILLGFTVGFLTLEVFLIAGWLFLLTEFVVKICFGKNIRKDRNSNCLYVDKYPIVIKQRLMNFILFLFVVSFVIALYVMLINTGGGTFSAKMEQYKDALLYSSGKVRYRFIVSQLYKINTSISCVLGYVLVYNYSVCNVKVIKMKKIVYLIVLFCLFSMISQGARQPVVEMLLFLGLVYLSLNLGKENRIKIRKFVLKIIPVLIIVIVFFYFSATLVGRRESERGILEYLTVYFSGGLYAFDLHVAEPARNSWWGQSSFADIYSILIDLNFVPDAARASYREFDLYGNTVTIFGRWYEDFGAIGVYIMTVIVAFCFSVYFYKVVNKTYYRLEPHVARLLYCKFLIALVWAGYDDRIRALLSTQTLVLLMLIPLFFRFITLYKAPR